MTQDEVLKEMAKRIIVVCRMTGMTEAQAESLCFGLLGAGVAFCPANAPLAQPTDGTLPVAGIDEVWTTEQIVVRAQKQIAEARANG